MERVRIPVCKAADAENLLRRAGNIAIILKLS